MVFIFEIKPLVFFKVNFKEPSKNLKMKTFVKGRAKSITYAYQGLFYLLKTEHAIIAQTIIFLVFSLIAYLVNFEFWEWIIQLFCFGFIFSVEALNTAIEKLCDFIHTEYHPKIGLIKDMAAGAVAFAVTFSIFIGCVLYYHHFSV